MRLLCSCVLWLCWQNKYDTYKGMRTVCVCRVTQADQSQLKHELMLARSEARALGMDLQNTREQVLKVRVVANQ